MLIGKNVRRVSHNLIISKYFEEENNEIQNQYFIRNVADELSVISLGFGGFFVVINPCDFAIEYSSETFKDMIDINLKEVVLFEAKAATVFRIENLDSMPVFDFQYIKSQLETDEERNALEQAIAEVTGINDQYSIEQGSLGTSFDSIELNVEALNAANYKHLESEEYKVIANEEEADELEVEIAKRKQELEQLNQVLASKEEILNRTESALEASEQQEAAEYDDESEEAMATDFADFSSALDQLNDLVVPDDLFAMLDDLEDEVSASDEVSSEQLEDADGAEEQEEKDV